MRVTDYTQAVEELIASGTPAETVFDGLHATLARRGHTALLPKILRNLEKSVARTNAQSIVRVTIANDAHKESLKDDITAAVHALGATSHALHIDPTITGGFIAESSDKRIDKSYKTTLLTLYRSLID